MLIMQMNPVVWDALPQERREEVMSAHEGFIKLIQDSGEMVGSNALGAPADSVTVRGREGGPAVTDGPYAEAKEYMGGYYLVECASKERAVELASLIPDTGVDGMAVEVRPVIFSTGSAV
ncbi:YciI family protein [Sphaerisporangium sp. TRM90804]|uniref:YciI family protein n=1 Tax=Sphaerisporangium sp. TRM90804 TaxID=3031113 RepID=UPI00244B7AD2|nr:YciI family protein [Sphaerisporangium sp. TRM90804]MDH2425962.1 YciI family protein [Sphaerisporangium sp. TRM90804]